jgi:hypothetical protein
MMNKNAGILASIQDLWESSKGISWELAGDIFGVLILAAVLFYVVKESKKFKKKIDDE